MSSQVFEMVTEDEAAKLLKEQMKMDPEKLEHYLNLFEQWMSTQENLKQLNFSRLCYMKFLVWAKLDFEKAKAKFINYCYSSLTYKEFVLCREITPEMDLKCLKYSYFLPMPKLTPEKYRVIILNTFQPDICDILEVCRYAAISYDFPIHKEYLPVGTLGIIDMQHWKTHHYSSLFTTTLFRFLKYCLQCYPLNVRKIVIINLDSIMEKGINLCLTMLPEKIRNRVLILRSHKDLHEHFPKECLPSDYDGDLKSFKEIRDDWAKSLVENRDFLEKIWNVKPSGPIPKQISLDDGNFGVEGSFRKLNID